jgi:hypothetical protein
LTALLNRDWKLSPLLASVLDPSARASPRTRAVGFGHELAHALVGSPGAASLDEVLVRIRRSLNLKSEETEARVLHNARAAADTIARLGAPEVARLIPVSGGVELPGADGVLDGPTAHPTDSGLQLAILRELTQLMLEPRPDVNLMLEMVLEGIFRGVGMDCAVFALLSPDRAHIRAKFVLGADREMLQRDFVFAVDSPADNPLAAALHSGQPAWVGGGNGPVKDPQLLRISGGECFLMPLAVAGKPIGCLYADRARSGRPMSEELFAQFKLFGQQARMGLSYLKAH